MHVNIQDAFCEVEKSSQVFGVNQERAADSGGAFGPKGDGVQCRGRISGPGMSRYCAEQAAD